MHWENCEASICQDKRAYEENPEWEKTVAWYPGEPVCGKKPYTKWQKRQTRINRWVEAGKWKYPGLYFTAESLSKVTNLRKELKGRNPDM